MPCSLSLWGYFIFMPILFECEQEPCTRLEIHQNGSLLDLTIVNENEEISLYVMIDYNNAEILINEIRKVVNKIIKEKIENNE